MFDWPDEGVHGRLLSQLRSAGLANEHFFTWKGNTRTLLAEGLRSQLGIKLARFIHIDGDHTHECLSHDLELAHHALHPSGMIVLDDMLHPGYPELIVTVLDYLKRHPDMVVVCIIDREDISAAAKFMLCRAEAAAVTSRI